MDAVNIFGIVVLLSLASVIMPFAGRSSRYLALVAFLVSFFIAIGTFGKNMEHFDALVSNNYSALFALLFLSIAILVVIYTKEQKGEFFSFLSFSTLGMILAVSADDLLMMYLGIELSGISTYLLVGFLLKKDSLEAMIKYFLFGAVFSGILIFGISIFYGVFGTIEFSEMAPVSDSLESTALAAALLIIAGLGFKLSLMPFHFWIPDVYEKTRPEVAGFIASTSKKMAYAVLIKIILVFTFIEELYKILALLAIITMVLAGLMALAQRDVRRMLAYSSITHAGFIMAGVAMFFATQDAYILGITIFYMVVHAFMKFLSFISVSELLEKGISKVSDFQGLYRKNLPLTFSMTSSIGSLAGIYPAGGFIPKILLVLMAFGKGFFEIGAAMVISILVSLYFYSRIINNIYFVLPGGKVVKELLEEGEEHGHGSHDLIETEVVTDIEKFTIGRGISVMLILLGIFLLLIGIYPVPFMEASEAAGKAVMGL